MQRTPMTPRAAEMLRAELQELKTTGRTRLSAAIGEARAHGDLKENAEYHAAKEQQGLMEARIRYLESRLSSAQIIDISELANEGKVIFGAFIELQNSESETIVTYQVVCEDEADLKQNKISLTSPLARGMMGKYEGDEVTVRTPNGEVVYEIISVRYS